MPTEQDRTYTVKLAGADFYKNQLIRPSAVLAHVQRVVDEHLDAEKVSVPDLAPYNLAWVLTMAAVRIQPIVLEGTTLSARTWMSQQKGPYFRREVEFFTPSSERVLRFSSFSVLMDLKERTIARPSVLPVQLKSTTPEFVIDALSPKLHMKCPLEHCYTDVIRNCHIDLLGHANNSFYADFALNCLNEEEFAQGISEMDINYLSELTRGTQYSLARGKDELGNIWVEGTNADEEKRSFCARIKLF